VNVIDNNQPNIDDVLLRSKCLEIENLQHK
jgi:hypothetical protein